MTPMVLYLCQHGEALSKDVDPDRPLSERGTADVCNMANALSGGVDVGLILHSGKTRAQQTAELLHERLAPDASLEADSELAPDDSVENFAGRLDAQDGNLMVVGHMPFVGGLASRLLGSDNEILAFVPGTVAALSRAEDGGWTLSWMLTPGLVHD